MQIPVLSLQCISDKAAPFDTWPLVPDPHFTIAASGHSPDRHHRHRGLPPPRSRYIPEAFMARRWHMGLDPNGGGDARAWRKWWAGVCGVSSSSCAHRWQTQLGGMTIVCCSALGVRSCSSLLSLLPVLLIPSGGLVLLGA
jgi:hypothetical protein